jgi:hypothetical protein
MAGNSKSSSRKSLLNKYIKAKEKMHEEIRKKYSKETPKECPKGYILREGYKKKSFKSHSKKGKEIKVKGYDVKPDCIKSQTGKSEKGEKLIVIMEKDVLGKYGYDDVKNTSATKRHTALKKALKELKPLSVYRRLIAIATLNKNKDSEVHDILRADAEWVKKQMESEKK